MTITDAELTEIERLAKGQDDQYRHDVGRLIAALREAREALAATDRVSMGEELGEKP